jgi:hypothetical protein
MNYCTGALDHLDAVKDNIKRDLNKYDKTGFMCLRTGNSYRLSERTFWFCKT